MASKIHQRVGLHARIASKSKDIEAVKIFG